MTKIIFGYNDFLMRRRKLLESCDWMFSPNRTVYVENDTIKLWKIYRQELRDVPQKNKDIPKAWKWLIPLNPDEWKALNERATENYKLRHNYSTDAEYLSVPQHFITYKQDILFRYTIFTEKMGIYAKTKEEELNNLLRNIIDNT